MAEDILSAFNSSDIFSSVWENMPPEIMQNITKLLSIAKIILILIIIYWIVIIIGRILGLRNAGNIKKIEKNVEEINQKISAIFEKKSKKKADKPDEKK
jgi:hypothetical protein